MDNNVRSSELPSSSGLGVTLEKAVSPKGRQISTRTHGVTTQKLKK
jgi:hypothetical protein